MGCTPSISTPINSRNEVVVSKQTQTSLPLIDERRLNSNLKLRSNKYAWQVDQQTKCLAHFNKLKNMAKTFKTFKIKNLRASSYRLTSEDGLPTNKNFAVQSNFHSRQKFNPSLKKNKAIAILCTRRFKKPRENGNLKILGNFQSTSTTSNKNYPINENYFKIETNMKSKNQIISIPKKTFIIKNKNNSQMISFTSFHGKFQIRKNK